MQKPKPRYAAEINDGIWGVRREYVYLCHEMDPYIEQLEKQLAAFEGAYTSERPSKPEPPVILRAFYPPHVEWNDEEECFIVSHVEEPGSIAKLRTMDEVKAYLKKTKFEGVPAEGVTDGE